MAVFIVLWSYLLTTKLRCLQKKNIGHTNVPSKPSSRRIAKQLCAAEFTTLDFLNGFDFVYVVYILYFRVHIQLLTKVLGHLADLGVKWCFSNGRGRK